MKIIEPSVELMRTGLEKEFITPEQFIEKVGRTCYKSEDKITDESAEKFVRGLIKRGHEAMIEHWSVIFKVNPFWYTQIVDDYEMLTNTFGLRHFLRFTNHEYSTGEVRCIVSGNMRAWRDFVKAGIDDFGFVPQYLHGVVRNYPLFFPEFQDYVPGIIQNDKLFPISVSELTEPERKIHQDVTVKFVCDRGVSHEIVRHRTSSFAQESTRYCNYGLDKFGNEITVIRPSWCKEGEDVYTIWRDGCILAEGAYFSLLSENATPQEARSVLPNSLKTEIIMTTNLIGWDHFFELRCAPDAHPDIQEVAKMAKRLFDNPKVFNGDVNTESETTEGIIR